MSTTNIVRAVEGVLTWTDVVAGISANQTEWSRGSAYNVVVTTTETALQSATLTLATSSANTGTAGGAVIYVDYSRANPVLVAKINSTITDLASAG
jgi:hypothetical protein